MSTPILNSEPALDLRCRDAEWIDRPATVAEFQSAAPALDRHGALAELLIADMVARSHTEIARLLAGRVLLSVEHARFGIPLGVRDLDAPPVDDWRIEERIDVELLDASPEGRLERTLAAQIRRGLIAVAGALPLLASPMLAHAHAPLDAALAGASLAFAPPTLPKEPEPAPAAEPAPSDPSNPSNPGKPSVQPTAAPQVGPSAAPPPRIANDSLTLTGTNVWEGLLGRPVRLTMKNEQTLDGVLIAQSTTDLAIARASDGTVVSVPKAEVAGIRLNAAAAGAGAGAGDGTSAVPLSERPTEDGFGLNAGGAVMIGFGSIAALAGTVMLGIYPSGVYIHLPLLLPGLAMIGGGSAMMASASKKRKAIRRAWGMPSAKVNMVPTVSASRSGGEVGLVLRF
ncbi:MAG: hypothetical protein R6X02_29970 [Enhygromyxa sp.]